MYLIVKMLCKKVSWNANKNIKFQITYINPFQPSVVFHIETSHLFLLCKTNDWFLYETQRWPEMS